MKVSYTPFKSRCSSIRPVAVLFVPITKKKCWIPYLPVVRIGRGSQPRNDGSMFSVPKPSQDLLEKIHGPKCHLCNKDEALLSNFADNSVGARLAKPISAAHHREKSTHGSGH